MAQREVARAGVRRARFPVRLLFLVTTLVAGSVLVFQWQRGPEPFAVIVEISEQPPRIIMTEGGTVAEVLQAAGITVGEYDRVIPDRTEPVSPELNIVVQRALPVTIIADGAETEHWVFAATVGEALRAAGVDLGPLDRVEPSRGTPIEPHASIRVVRVVEEFIEETERLPYKVLRWAAPDLERGQTQVLRKGREGIIKNTVRVVYEDGRPVSRTIVSSEVVQSVVDEIIGEGTRTSTLTVDTPEGPLPYIEVREMVATGYEPGPISTGEWSDGLTFTGLRAQRGIIAVDPTVIPLGTRLYVEGYGLGVAADIGGAIKGNRIDLCFDTYEEAIQWGRRTVKVYILAE